MDRHKQNRRYNDSIWYKKMLGEGYMADKTVHHLWNNGEYAFVLLLAEHQAIHGITPGGLE